MSGRGWQIYSLVCTVEAIASISNIVKMTWYLLEYSNIRLDSSQSTWEEGFLKIISRQFFSFIPPQYTIKTGFELSSTHVYWQ